MNTFHKIFVFKPKLVLVFLLLGFLIISPALAKDDLSKTSGLDTAANKGFNTNVENSSNIMTSIPEAIGKIIGSLLAFIGVLFFLLMIYGGIIWMTARGNETEVTKAKDLIQSAVIGLVIVLAAYVITAFVSEQLVN